MSAFCVATLRCRGASDGPFDERTACGTSIGPVSFAAMFASVRPAPNGAECRGNVLPQLRKQACSFRISYPPESCCCKAHLIGRSMLPKEGCLSSVSPTRRQAAVGQSHCDVRGAAQFNNGRRNRIQWRRGGHGTEAAAEANFISARLVRHLGGRRRDGQIRPMRRLHKNDRNISRFVVPAIFTIFEQIESARQSNTLAIKIELRPPVA